MDRRKFITAFTGAFALPANSMFSAADLAGIKAKPPGPPLPNITLTHKVGYLGSEEVHMGYDHLDWLNPKSFLRVLSLFDTGQPHFVLFGHTPAAKIMSWFPSGTQEFEGGGRWGRYSLFYQAAGHLRAGLDPSELDMAKLDGRKVWHANTHVDYCGDPGYPGAIYAVYMVRKGPVIQGELVCQSPLGMKHHGAGE